MLDLTGIMFSSLMMLFIIVRAVQLDRTQPWFQTLTRKKDAAPDAKQAGGRGAPWRRSADRPE